MNGGSNVCHSNYLPGPLGPLTGHCDQGIASGKRIYSDCAHGPLVSVRRGGSPEPHGGVRTATWRLAFKGPYQVYCRRYDSNAVSALAVSLVVHPVREAQSPNDQEY